ncbi:MAG: hypothetical protein ABFD89_16665 [Bryobacteraceae bacterium]
MSTRNDHVEVRWAVEVPDGNPRYRFRSDHFDWDTTTRDDAIKIAREFDHARAVRVDVRKHEPKARKKAAK